MDLIEKLRGEQLIQQNDYCRGLEVIDDAIDEIKRLRDELASLKAQAEATQYDFSDVINLTHRKTKDIIERDNYKITGFVLTKDSSEKCIVDMSAVRWFFDRQDFFKMMHPQ